MNIKLGYEKGTGDFRLLFPVVTLSNLSFICFCKNATCLQLSFPSAPRTLISCRPPSERIQVRQVKGACGSWASFLLSKAVSGQHIC